MLNHVDVLTVQISTILSVKHKTTDSDDIGGGGADSIPVVSCSWRGDWNERGEWGARGPTPLTRSSPLFTNRKRLGSSLGGRGGLGGGEGEVGVIEIKLFKVRTNQKTGKLDFDRQPIK